MPGSFLAEPWPIYELMNDDILELFGFVTQFIVLVGIVGDRAPWRLLAVRPHRPSLSISPLRFHEDAFLMFHGNRRYADYYRRTIFPS